MRKSQQPAPDVAIDGGEALPGDRFGPFGLSRQESRVLALAMEGNIDKQIAAEMGISLGTVRVYWKRIRQKTGATRSESIASLAQRDLQAEYDGLRRRGDDIQSSLETRAWIGLQASIYERAFHALYAPFAIFDATTMAILFANHAFTALFGVTEDTLEGRSIQEWVGISHDRLIRCTTIVCEGLDPSRPSGAFKVTLFEGGRSASVIRQ